MIAYDASATSSTTGTSLTFAHTCSGANRILFVAVTTNTADNVDYITGVTYNGVAMTQVDSFRSQGLGGHELYMLVNPASGANNVVVSASGSVAIYAAASSYTGALQTGQPNTNNGNASDPATTSTVSVTTTVDNCWLISSAGTKAGAGATASASTGTVTRQANGYVSIGDSNGVRATAGSHGQTWMPSASTGIAVIVAAIAPAAGEQVTQATVTSVSGGDGTIYNDDAGTWATVKGLTTGTAQGATDPSNVYAGNSASRCIGRGFLPFDTSSIPAGAVIQNATLQINVTALPGSSGGTFHVVQTTQTDPTSLASADFDNIAGSSGSMTTGGSTTINVTGAKTVPLNATGLGFITGGGYTKLALCNDHDATNTDPGASMYRVSINYAENGTAANRPTLTVDYTLPESGQAVWFM